MAKKYKPTKEIYKMKSTFNADTSQFKIEVEFSHEFTLPESATLAQLSDFKSVMDEAAIKPEDLIMKAFESIFNEPFVIDEPQEVPNVKAA